MKLHELEVVERMTEEARWTVTENVSEDDAYGESIANKCGVPGGEVRRLARTLHLKRMIAAVARRKTRRSRRT